MLKIRFRSSGDITGVMREAAIDLDHLPQDMAAQFSGIARFIQRSGKTGAPAGAARDVGQYEIEIIDGPHSTWVGYSQMAIPEQVLPLVQHLKRIAKPAKL